MKSSAGDELFLLIMSMDRTEKRYFRLHAKAGQGQADKNYLLLYDFLLKQPAWDEQAIRSAFPQAPFLRQLNVARDYLFHLILDALRSFHQGKTVISDFAKRLVEIEILFHRKQYAACSRIIDASIRRTIALQLPAQEIEIRKWELRLLRQTLPPNIHTSVSNIHQRQRWLTQQLSIEIELTVLVDQLADIMRGIPTAATKEQIILHTQQALRSMDLNQSTLLFEARLLYHHLLGYLDHINGNPQGYFSHNESIIQTWEDLPDRIRLDEDRYFRVLANYAESCTQALKHDLVPRVIAKMKRLLHHTKRLKETEQVRLELIELQHRIAMDHWEAALAGLPQLHARFIQHRLDLTAPVRLAIISNSIVTYAMNHQWATLLTWLTTTSQLLPTSEAKAIGPVSRVARWIAWYSTAMHHELEADIRPSRTGDLDPVLQSIAHVFHQLLQSQSESDETSIRQQLLQSIQLENAQRPAPHLELLQRWATTHTP